MLGKTGIAKRISVRTLNSINMKKILFGICFLLSLPVMGQQYLLAESTVNFYSSAPMENIEATTTKSKSLFNAQTGEIAIIIPVKTFEFEKKLMQEHFNENYLESHNYPEATFKGKITGFDPQQKGAQKAVARGEMNIHGVSRSIDVTGTLEFKGDEVLLLAKFPVRVADYKVDIPQLVFYNIAEVVDITFKAKYLPHAKQ